jgi:protein dithiol oxidoreductase (disulfide-forming)
MRLRLALSLTALLPIAAACSSQDAATAEPAATAAAPAPTAGEGAATEATAAPELNPAAVAAVQAAMAASADRPPPVEGTDYVVIADGQPFEPLDGKVEVVEAFGYTCPHCANFQPLVNAWKAQLPDDVRFTYVAAPFGGYWIPYAKAYYAAEAEGVLAQSHDAMFRALHIERSLPIQGASSEQIAQWYAKYGVDPTRFAATMDSFGTNAKLNRARQFLQRSGVDGTPGMVVNGKYKVTARSLEDTLRITHQLVEMERNAAQGSGDQAEAQAPAAE